VSAVCTSARRAIGLTLAALTLLAVAGCTGGDDATAPTTFAGTLYLADANEGADLAQDATLAYNEAVVALPTPGDTEAKFAIPEGAETALVFIAPQGREADPAAWNATSYLYLTEGGIWLPNVTPMNQLDPGPGVPSGTQQVMKAGGAYSLGVAFTDNATGEVVDGGLYFVHIDVTPESGDYTWSTVEAG
jgi:hypothetical protein